MENLKHDLNILNNSITELENQIKKAEREAEDNIKPLKSELAKVKQ